MPIEGDGTESDYSVSQREETIKNRSKSAVQRLVMEEEERKKFKERSESNLSEVEKASKKLSAKDLTGKTKKKKRDTREDLILD